MSNSNSDPDLNPLLHRISNSLSDAKDKDIERIYEYICELNEIKPSKGPDELASKIRMFGSNDFANTVAPYKKIVKDVAKKLDVEISDTLSIEKMEVAILKAVAKKYWDGLSEEERNEIIERIKEIDPKIKDDAIKNAMLVGGMGASIALRGVIGPLIRSIITKYIAASIGSRLAGMFVPVLNVIMAVSFIVSAAGPAYRKTVPTVVAIAMLRLDCPSD